MEGKSYKTTKNGSACDQWHHHWARRDRLD